MAKSASILLSDHFAAFIDGLVQTGRYGSASAAVRAGLGLLEREEAHLAWMQAQIERGAADTEAGKAEEDSDELGNEPDRKVGKTG
jgi:antitoxin ParD1/3/4